MLISGSVVDILLGFYYIVWLNQCISIWSLFQGPSTCCNLQNIGETVSIFSKTQTVYSTSHFMHIRHIALDAYYALTMIVVGLLHVLTSVVTLRMLDILFKEVQM